MACGTPVIVSNVSSLPEVVGDAALLVDPHNDEEITVALWRVLTDPSCGRSCGPRACNVPAAFSWERAAEQTMAVYRKAACLNPSSGGERLPRHKESMPNGAYPDPDPAIALSRRRPSPAFQGTTIRNFNLIAGLAQRHELTCSPSAGALPAMTQARRGTSAADRSGDAGPAAPLLRRPSWRSLRRCAPWLAGRAIHVLNPLPDMALRLASPTCASLAGLLRENAMTWSRSKASRWRPMPAAWLRAAWQTSRPRLVFDDHNAEYVLQQRAFLTDVRRPRRWLARRLLAGAVAEAGRLRAPRLPDGRPRGRRVRCRRGGAAATAPGWMSPSCPTASIWSSTGRASSPRPQAWAPTRWSSPARWITGRTSTPSSGSPTLCCR